MCFQQSAVHGRGGRNCWYPSWKWDVLLDGEWNIIWHSDVMIRVMSTLCCTSPLNHTSWFASSSAEVRSVPSFSLLPQVVTHQNILYDCCSHFSHPKHWRSWLTTQPLSPTYDLWSGVEEEVVHWCLIILELTVKHKPLTATNQEKQAASHAGRFS